MSYTNGLDKPSDYFNTVLYTGDGSASDRTITGVGFQPDWLWNKSRSNAYNHYIFDVLRGTNMLSSNATLGQEDKSPQFSAFTSDGFTIRNDAGSLAINASGVTFANWCWRANGAGVSNTDGTITSTVSANQTSGFSIVKWTGTGADGTIGHGLNAVPKMVIVKSLANTTAWMVYHASLGNAQEIYLNSSSASGASTAWNSTTPTSSVISLDGGAGNGVNASGDYVAYVFAEKKGFSKFGSYTGNGSTDGTFVYTGFKPKYVLTKRTDGSYIWSITDGVRNPYNPTSLTLQTEYADAESGWSPLEVDFLSNGFKLRTSSAQKNGSGSPFIYMAFAEHPLVSSTGVPCTAR